MTKAAKESHARSIIKAITWRLIASATTFLLAFMIFQQTDCDDVVEKSTIVALAEMGIKLLLYYFHERMWQVLPRGSVRTWFGKK